MPKKLIKFMLSTLKYYSQKVSNRSATHYSDYFEDSRAKKAARKMEELQDFSKFMQDYFKES
jgi:hypothetical protein